MQLSSDAMMDCSLGEHDLDAYEALGRGRSTPREQQSLKRRIRLPRLHRYPEPPGCAPDIPEDCKQDALLRVYQEFVLNLNRGVHMTQLTPTREYTSIHCQILNDLQTLKVDQGSGCIVEFPLSAVSRVYRIFKNEDKNNRHDRFNDQLRVSGAQHIIVLEFMHRKLAFVFTDMADAQRFFVCIDLVILRVQEDSEDPGPIMGCVSAPAIDEGSTLVPIFSKYTLKESDINGDNYRSISQQQDHQEHHSTVMQTPVLQPTDANASPPPELA